MHKSRVIILITALAGLAVSALPWVYLYTFFGGYPQETVKPGYQGEAFGSMGLFALAAILVFLGNRGGLLSKGLKWAIAITGVLVVAYCCWYFLLVRSDNEEFSFLQSKVGEGFYATFALGIILALAGLLVKKKQP